MSALSEILSPVFDPGFPSWENPSLLDQHMSIFFESNPEPVNSNSGSDKSNSPVDERKQRRMQSNRESARRSRMRKQRHLEDLRNTVNRLRLENRDISNRLDLVNTHTHLLKRDNDRLLSESSVLRHRLSDIRRILILRQLQRCSSPLLHEQLIA